MIAYQKVGALDAHWGGETMVDIVTGLSEPMINISTLDSAVTLTASEAREMATLLLRAANHISPPLVGNAG